MKYKITSHIDKESGHFKGYSLSYKPIPFIPYWKRLYHGLYCELKNMVMGKKDMNGEEGPRVRSWGLAVTPESIGLTDVKVGQDLTEQLEIRKYEPEDDASPTSGGGRTKYPWIINALRCSRYAWCRKIAHEWIAAYGNKGGFPTDLISKSDETTVQNMPWVLTEHADDIVYTTAKMEGQSVTALLDVTGFFGFKKVKFYVCSRNQAYKRENENAFWTFAKNHDLPRKFMDYYKRTGLVPIIQAEQCGPGIQNNIYNFDALRWFVYEVKEWNPKTGLCAQVDLDKMIKIAIELGLDHVPILDRDVKLKEIMPDVESAVKYAERAYYRIAADEEGRIENFRFAWNDGIDPDFTLWRDYMQHEGVVVRLTFCDKDQNLGCSFKIKNIAYAENDLSKMAKAVRNNLLK